MSQNMATIDWNKTCVKAPDDSEALTPLEGGPARGLFANDWRRLWPNGKTLSYRFLEGHPGTPRQQNKVHKVVKEWEVYANVSFVHDDSPDAIIRTTFNEHDGSWSYIGRDVELPQHRGKATMNLGWVDNTTDDITGSDRGVILHEFGHTLGLLHEHKSPDHGGVLTLKENAIIEFYTTKKKWTKEQVRNKILHIYNGRGVSNSPRVDYKSIMLHFMPAEMNEECLEITPNNKLSDTDKAYMTINYPREFPTENGWSVERALDVAGIDDESIIQNYQANPNGWDGLRRRFVEWMESAHARQNKPLSPEAQAIADGFKRMGVERDPRMSYGMIPP